MVPSSSRLAVAAQDGFQVTAQVCVSVPNFLIVLFHFYKRFGKASVSHEGPYRTTGEVRLAFGPSLDHFPRRRLVLQNYAKGHKKRSYIRPTIRLI